MDSMVGTALTIEREILRMHGVSKIRVLVARRVRISLLLVRGKGRRLLLREDFRDWVAAIGAKGRPGLPVRWDKRSIFSSNSLDI